ncbi:MAG: Scr1 family TA system antitoxin-like transcriptional regulator, partial [Pseudonocardiaceae bacterium]
MSTGRPSPAKQAREALGVRLREIRKDAGLTGRALAVGIGCHYTKVSRIENGAQAPYEENIKAWCRVCRAEDQIPDLIATARAIESMYLEWQRQTRTGMKRVMVSSLPRYERTKLFRIYEHNVVPGLFQTAKYSAEMLSYFIDFPDAPNNLDAAVETRMERQRIVYSGDRRFAVVLEEQAIRKRVGDLDTMAGVEAPTAFPEITQPREIRLYAKMFEQLQQSAVYGAEARALVTSAMADLASS